MSKTPPKPVPQPKSPVINNLRQAIAEAEAAGGDRKAMTLRLTAGDAALIKRSRDVAADEVRFSEGVMYFLGVRAEIGEVTTSSLQDS
jgi:hypothetical protein